MTILQLAALFFLVGILIVFYGALIGLLTLLRRGRPVSVPVVSPIALAVRAEPPPVRYASPIPPAWRIPIQPGRPNDVIIHIEPEEKSTARRRAIERIVAHFEERAS